MGDDEPDLGSSELNLRLTACLTLVLATAIAAGCNGSGPSRPSTEESLGHAQSVVSFPIVVPSYLPSGVSAEPDIKVTPSESVRLTFYPKVQSDDPDPTAPLVYITQKLTDARPLTASESADVTERRLRDKTITFQSGRNAKDEVFLAGSWRDGDLLWEANLIWWADSPEQKAASPEMEAEAVKVIESLIGQEH